MIITSILIGIFATAVCLTLCVKTPGLRWWRRFTVREKPYRVLARRWWTILSVAEIREYPPINRYTFVTDGYKTKKINSQFPYVYFLIHRLFPFGPAVMYVKWSPTPLRRIEDNVHSSHMQNVQNSKGAVCLGSLGILKFTNDQIIQHYWSSVGNQTGYESYQLKNLNHEMNGTPLKHLRSFGNWVDSVCGPIWTFPFTKSRLEKNVPEELDN